MALFQYVAGLKWAFYDQSETFTSINSCKFASNGLEVVYLTSEPIHILILETLTGRLKYAYKTPNRYEISNFGLETRL